jgi:hypothetical protein
VTLIGALSAIVWNALYQGARPERRGAQPPRARVETPRSDGSRGELIATARR